MLITNMFCPVCSGHVVRYIGPVMTAMLSRGHVYEQGEYIACENCAMSSEVDSRTGTLIDLGNIRLQDILVPNDEPHIFVQDATHPLLGRQDS